MSLDISSKIKNLPAEPGIYLMKNQSAKIIYIGKAKHLKNRVSSYFIKSSSHTGKTQALVREISDFEVIITGTESEALLLERSMIRHHQPHFNILLRDDKEYPYIRVNFRDDWPRIEKVRKRQDDGASYIGPFSHASFLSLSLKTISRVFPLIRCSPHEFANAKRPCNYYHMKMCLGPCTLPVNKEEYKDMIKEAVRIFKGQHRELEKDLQEKMLLASQEQKYEYAASIRDQIKALKALNERQSVIIKDVDEADAIGIYQQENHASVQVLMVRQGQLLGSESFFLETPIQTKDEVLASFLFQYYENRALPEEILLSSHFEEIDTIFNSLNANRAEPNSKYLIPQRGPKLDLCKMAEKNAAHAYQENSLARSQQRIDLKTIQELLGMKQEPHRAECIDISNIQGTAIVASNVCFIQGKPRKDLYRIYGIQSVGSEGPDDFQSIREVVKRRILRAIRDHDAPDLLIIDGGKGQLSSAVEALDALPGLPITIVSLAKSRADSNTPDHAPGYSEERIFLPDREHPIPLETGSVAYRFFTQLRDEAHRFAIKHHRNKRSKISIGSSLENIPGIGPTLRKRLIQSFGGLDGLKKASLDELYKIKGMKKDIALVLFSKLKDEI